MKPYTATLQHSEDTIRDLCRIQFRSANRNMLPFGYGCVFISISVGGLFAFESLWAVAFVFLGCWAMMAIRQTPNRRAERIITRLGGKFPAIDYTFDEENFTANFGANADLVPYGEVVRLIEDKTYCYFFLKSFSVYMFAQKSAENPEELKEYLATQTGLRWRAGKDLFSVSLKDILDAVMTRI